MNEAASGGKPQRYFMAEKATALFAAYLDQYHCRKLGESLSEVSDTWLGCRTTLDYAPEVALLTRGFYYTSSLLCYGCTPGQAFCSLAPMKFVESSSGSNKAIRSPGTREMVLLVVCYTLLPYLYDRRDEVWRGCAQLLETLRAEEEERPFDWMASKPDPEIPQRESSFLSTFLKAVQQSWSLLAADNSTRFTHILTFLAELHQLFFLLYGKSLEIPMTVANLQLVNTASPSSKLKLDAITWLAAFQTSLHLYYVGRVICNEMDAALSPQPSGEGSRSPSPSDTARVTPLTAADKTSLHYESILTPAKRCALCLDDMAFPSSIPCGHVFCWSCILSYANKKERAESGIKKCPVCRCEFKSHRVRYLHNYA